MTKIAALFVEAGGIYSSLKGVEMWDETRDARNYAGPYPVVAHPPCGRWCQLASVNEKRWGAKIGDDGGCFQSALTSVRIWGGVLEHPAYTLAWKEYDLPIPVRGVWRQNLLEEGWVTEISQSAYGHPARKRTWLYYIGESPPPDLNWADQAGYGVVGAGIHSGESAGRPRIEGREASATPEAFRDVLISMARGANG